MRSNLISTREQSRHSTRRRSSGETQFSAQQSAPQAQARLPRAHALEGRAEDPCAAPRAQAQDAFGLSAAAADPCGPLNRLVMARLKTLKRRGDFVRLKSGRKWVTPAFVLQAMPRAADAVNDESGPRFGFTVSSRAVAQDRPDGRKRGNAVRRNRARRRLREAVRLVAPTAARPDFDYVVVGRAGALERDFNDLLKDLRNAFDKVHSLNQNRERKTPRGRRGQARQNS